MNTHATKDVVAGVLDEMERHARNTKLGIFAAAAVEGLLLAAALLVVNWSDRTHILILVVAVLGYTVIALGLVALGAHISRVGARVVAALDRGKA